MRNDYEEDDDLESFLKFHNEKQKEAERKAATTGNNTEDEYYEEDMKKGKKRIEVLPPVDHSKIQYPKLEKNFYKPPSKAMAPEAIKEYRHSQRSYSFHFCLTLSEIRVSWEKDWQSPPPPCLAFADYGFEAGLMNTIAKAGYEVSSFVLIHFVL